MIQKESVVSGVAQNHSNLFMSPRQRIPGLIEGQIYTYPSKRWRKKRRQYLMNFMQPRRKELDPESDLHTISTVENPAASNEDSKDSAGLKDEAAKVIVHNMCLVFVHMAYRKEYKVVCQE
jgi:zinc finger protein ubi-d4